MGFLKPKVPDRPPIDDDVATPAQHAARARRQRQKNAGAARTTVAGNTSSNKPKLGGPG